MEDRKLATVMGSWHYSWDIERFFESLYLYETASHGYLFNLTPIPYVSDPCPLFSDDVRLTRIMARRGRFFPYWYLCYGSFSEFLDRRS
jgi:hypothetical protein